MNTLASFLPTSGAAHVETIDPVAKAAADKKLIADAIDSLTSDPNSTYVAEKVKKIMETLCKYFSKDTLNWCNNAVNKHPPVTKIGEYSSEMLVEFVKTNKEDLLYSLSHYGVITSTLELPDKIKGGKMLGGDGDGDEDGDENGDEDGDENGDENGDEDEDGLLGEVKKDEDGDVDGLLGEVKKDEDGDEDEDGDVDGLLGEGKKVEVNDDKVRIPETPQTIAEIDDQDPLSKLFNLLYTSIQCDPESHKLLHANVINSIFVSAKSELSKNSKDKIKQMFPEIAKEITGQLINKEIELILSKLDLLLYKIDHDTPEEKEIPEDNYINHLFQLYIFYKLNEKSPLKLDTLPNIDWTKYASSKCKDAITKIGDIVSINESLTVELYIINETLRPYMQNKKVTEDIITTFNDVTSEASETDYKKKLAEVEKKAKGAQMSGGNKISKGRKSKRKRSALRNQNKRTRKPNMKHRKPK
jgi:hypothetical protein